MYMIKSKRVLSLLILLLFSIDVVAKESDLNWSNLKQQQYIENLMACEYKLQEFKWSNNLWPEQNKIPKPSFSDVVELDKIQQLVLNNLYKQYILSSQFNTIINQSMLQQDIDRMARNSKDAKGLKVLFELFENDPETIAQCMSRPYLVNKIIHNSFKQHNAIQQFSSLAGKKQNINQWLSTQEMSIQIHDIGKGQLYLPAITGSNMTSTLKFEAATADTWSATSTNGPLDARRLHTAVWTGSEMIIWGGLDGNNTSINTGGRYNPSTDNWVITNSSGVPSGRYNHTAVWSGSEMIVWGGIAGSLTNTGGRYNPVNDSWTATNFNDAPDNRWKHKSVWTGSEMIVWGGNSNIDTLNSGGRYNPNTDSWLATNIDDAPSARERFVTLWTGSEMIVWGGYDGSDFLNTGGRYDPVNNSWMATNTDDAPSIRLDASSVWSGSEMIVWGGGSPITNTGGRYDPDNDSWIETNFVDAPIKRSAHTAVWTGSEMIVWGGISVNTGGRYNPIGDSWSETNTNGTPIQRTQHTAVWTGREMIVWGGLNSVSLNTMGVYYPYNTYDLGGTVSGLLEGNYIVVQNNGVDDKTITSNGSYVFDTALLDEEEYDVQILMQPNNPIQPCIVSNNIASIPGADVDEINIDCDLGVDLIYRNGFDVNSMNP